MRRLQSCFRNRFLILGSVLLMLAACGGGSKDDDGRIRQQQQGNFVDSLVNGLAYQTPTRSGSTGAGDPGSFAYLQDESVSFRLDCILLGSAAGQSVITPRTLASGNAATNIARLLLTLDADGNNANNVDVGYVDIPNNLCSTDFAQFPEADFESFVEQLIADGKLQRNQDSTAYTGAPAGADLVTAGYANAHLDCSLQGQTYVNGVCGSPPALSIGDVSATEGNSGSKTFTFTVNRSGNTGASASVTVATADNTATVADNDYEVVSATILSFGPNVTSQTASVTVNGDSTVEPNESFFVNLSNPVSAVIADGQGLGTIVNDDAVAGQSLFSVNDVAADEGDTGATTFTFTVSRTGDTGISASVTVATADNTATDANNDYEPVAATVLNFGPNVTSLPVNVTVNGDTTVEANESFFVNLSSPISGTITDSQGDGSIQNDDSAAPGSPAVSIADASVNEGNAGTTPMGFSVTLSSAPAQDVTVSYKTVDGTATSAAGPGQDFAGVSNGSLVIPANQTSGTITINVNGDLFQENDENFSVEITGVSNNATLGDTVGIGGIVNDDAITLLMAGASKRSITPTQTHINGVNEPRIDGTTRLQKFNLGGFGLNPFQNFPGDPLGGMQQIGEALTQPADERVFNGSHGEEDTHVRAMVVEQPDGARVAF
ncbi:MAG: Calx-beta domain-containing protein, partial [Nevskiales bacterium]